jgi:hypothetical protein
MTNILDYIKYYKNKTFDEIPFNDIDALILAELSYIDLKAFLNEDKMPITIENLGKEYFAKVKWDDMKSRSRLYKETYHLFEVMKDTKRFKDLFITNYKNIVDSEKQFGAITFRNNKKWVYIAFEGTDSSIIGWKEDFDLSHSFPVPSQKMAMDYLEDEVRFFDKNVYVGGHSKGGNLALISCVMASSFVKNRLKYIYNFDGPGLREEEYHSLAYKKISKKIKMFVPVQSVVGMIFCHSLNYTVVESSNRGLLQHDAFSWGCFGNVFIEGQLSQKSIVFSNEIKEFLKDMSKEERACFVRDIFLVLSKAEIDNTENVTFSKIVKATALAGELITDKKRKEKIKQVFLIIKKLF